MSIPGLVALLFLLASSSVAQTPVILISIDTLRADHLGVYGYRKTPTPNIDSFAEGGSIFSAIETHVPLTLPSHASILTSQYPFATRIEENGERVPNGTLTLASVLRSHGYKTGAFIGSVILSRYCGLEQGFDVYDSPFRLEVDHPVNPYQLRVRRDAALVTRAAEQWLGSNRNQPAFAFVHLFDLHTPYTLANYDAELAHVDEALGRFKAALIRDGWWDKSLVILLADHGESLGEHGESTHGYFVYESTLHVPLIVHWPSGSAQHPARVAGPGGLVDVAPTILGALHIPAPDSFQGRSLLGGEERPVVSESLYTADAFHWAPLRCVRIGKYKYVEAPKPELYDLATDPAEQSNLLRKDTARAQQLRSRLNSVLQRYASKSSFPESSPGSDAMLRSLGYLAGGSRSSIQTSGPDPKDRLPEYQLYEKALADLYGHRLEAAITHFRQLLAADSRNTLARYYLGEADAEAGRAEAALHEWETALAQDPTYVSAVEAIGELWVAKGDYPKAQTYFERILALSPNDFSAHFNLGLIAERLGDRKKAADEIQAACKPDPESAPCQRELKALGLSSK